MDDNGNLSSTDFIVDNNQDYAQVLHEVDSDTLTTEVSYTFGNDLLAQDRNGQLQTYHYDGLGSTRLLTDSTGNQTDSYHYEAFGELLNQTGLSDNNYLFTGEQFDSESDKYYLRNRYYSQITGRFWSMDQWRGNDETPVTFNKYDYVTNDPLNVIDPSGYFGISAQLSVISSVGARAVYSGVSYGSLFAKVGIGLLSSGLLRSDSPVVGILEGSPTGQKMLELERDKLENKVQTETRNRGAGKPIFHYSDRTATRSIMAEQCIRASKGFNHPDGEYRRSGAYATHLQPWFPITQKDLRELLYAKPRNQALTHFVAVDSAGFRTIGVEAYKPGPRGSCVSVTAIYAGTNLMLPE